MNNKSIKPAFALLSWILINSSVAFSDSDWTKYLHCKDEITQAVVQIHASTGELRARATQNGWGHFMDSNWVAVSQSQRGQQTVFASHEEWPVFYAEVEPSRQTMSSIRFKDGLSHFGVDSHARNLECQFFGRLSR